jgi:hypothetical protein
MLRIVVQSPDLLQESLQIVKSTGCNNECTPAPRPISGIVKEHMVANRILVVDNFRKF